MENVEFFNAYILQSKMDLAFICDLLDIKILSPPHCFLNTIINVHYHEKYNSKLSLSPRMHFNIDNIKLIFIHLK